MYGVCCPLSRLSLFVPKSCIKGWLTRVRFVCVLQTMRHRNPEEKYLLKSRPHKGTFWVQYLFNLCLVVWITDQEANPWWRVDLGAEHCIAKVTILNRGDCCSKYHNVNIWRRTTRLLNNAREWPQAYATSFCTFHLHLFHTQSNPIFAVIRKHYSTIMWTLQRQQQ